jgi:hypothetical protein
MGTLRALGQAWMDMLRDMCRSGTWAQLGRAFLSVDGAVVVLAAIAGSSLAARSTALSVVPLWLLVAVLSAPSSARLFAVAAGRVAMKRYAGLAERHIPTLWEVAVLLFFPLVPFAFAFVAVGFVAPFALGPVLFLLAVVLMERPLFRLATLLALSPEEADALVKARRWRNRRLPNSVPVAGLPASALMLISWLAVVVGIDRLIGSVLPQGLPYSDVARGVAGVFEGMALGLLLAHFYLPRVQSLVRLSSDPEPVSHPVATAAAPARPAPASVERPARANPWLALRNCPASLLFLCVLLLAWGVALVVSEYGVIALSGRFGAFHAELHRLSTQWRGVLVWPLAFSACGVLLALGQGWARWVFALAAAIHLVLVHQHWPLLGVLAIVYASSLALLYTPAVRPYFATAQR